MATQVFAGTFKEWRGSDTSLTTTAGLILLPKGAQFLALEAYNHSAAGVAAQVLLNPFLTVVKTADAGATWTDYSEAAQDADAATDVTLSSLDTLANGDALWVGSWAPFAGLSADVDAANGNASVLSGTYWNGTALSNISLTDNTAAAGATFAQDGTITWSVPTDWAPCKLRDRLSGANNAVVNGVTDLYWVRLVVSAALDSSTTLNSLVALNRSTLYATIKSGVLNQTIQWGHGGVGAIQAKTNSGTATLAAMFGAPVRFGD